MKPLLTLSFKPLLVLLAAIALLVQCLGGLSVVGLAAVGHQGGLSLPGYQTAAPSVEVLHFNNTTHDAMALSNGNLPTHEMPAMSCCEDESQPITLAELQLLPLIVLLGLIAVIIRVPLGFKPKTPFLSPRIRLHKLHCCWLN